ncbi:MAG: enoyl-CoA hydratase/isomerase family protein [Actinomycetales bacterium]|nr:MAG: enoyl-CoA hydratase/isomerase family protein [Actinomycetales bacterium]
MTQSEPLGLETRVEDGLGRIVLDRPRALNALTLAMVRHLRDVLTDWTSLGLRAVTVESASERAFCAGGDIRQVRQDSLAGEHEANEAFFATEYEVNHLLGTYPVPVVALVDGICMGGGIGLSVHGPFRVVTERAVLAMPETAIGFFPDVGTTHVLPRLPGAVGTYLGLTGARLDAADALHVGLATHLVGSEDLAQVPGLLAADPRPVEQVLRSVARPAPGTSVLGEHREAIDRVFSAPDVPAVLARLREETTPWAASTLELLESASPQSLSVTHDLLLWGRQRDLRACLDAELAAGRLVSTSPDFVEGVRAVLVDKDRSPRWGESLYRGTGPDGRLLWA